VKLHYATEIDRENKEHKHIRIHEIESPEYHEKGWSRAVNSRTAFFHGFRKDEDASPCGWTTTLYYGQTAEDFDLDGKSSMRSYRDELPRMRHTSLWDFYKYIGYDYKNRRYLGKEPIHKRKSFAKAIRARNAVLKQQHAT
jgi:hypothetical protein